MSGVSKISGIALAPIYPAATVNSVTVIREFRMVCTPVITSLSSAQIDRVHTCRAFAMVVGTRINPKQGFSKLYSQM